MIIEHNRLEKEFIQIPQNSALRQSLKKKFKNYYLNLKIVMKLYRKLLLPKMAENNYDCFFKSTNATFRTIHVPSLRIFVVGLLP